MSCTAMAKHVQWSPHQSVWCSWSAFVIANTKDTYCSIHQPVGHQPFWAVQQVDVSLPHTATMSGSGTARGTSAHKAIWSRECQWQTGTHNYKWLACSTLIREHGTTTHICSPYPAVWWDWNLLWEMHYFSKINCLLLITSLYCVKNVEHCWRPSKPGNHAQPMPCQTGCTVYWLNSHPVTGLMTRHKCCCSKVPREKITFISRTLQLCKLVHVEKQRHNALQATWQCLPLWFKSVLETENKDT